MRDGSIMQLQEANAKRSVLLFQQFEYLKTRQEAFEITLMGSSIWQRIKWACLPEIFLQVVQGVQDALMNKAREDYAKAQAKARLKL